MSNSLMVCATGLGLLTKTYQSASKKFKSDQQKAKSLFKLNKLFLKDMLAILVNIGYPAFIISLIFQIEADSLVPSVGIVIQFFMILAIRVVIDILCTFILRYLLNKYTRDAPILKDLIPLLSLTIAFKSVLFRIKLDYSVEFQSFKSVNVKSSNYSEDHILLYILTNLLFYLYVCYQVEELIHKYRKEAKQKKMDQN